MTAALYSQVATVTTTASLEPLADDRPVESDSTVPTVQPCTADELAAAAGVSRRMIFLALKVKRVACAELHRMVRDGSVGMNLAAALVDMFPHHNDQRLVMAEFHDLPARSWLGFARRVAALAKGGS